MRAMILAAGRGQRMGELTSHIPKPLLRYNQKYLIEYPLHSLYLAGIRDVVINISYHASSIQNALGDGARYDMRIHYSYESERLETGGGIVKALPLLGDAPFVVMSADIVTDFPMNNLFLMPEMMAHLIMVNNPAYHPHGDFGIENSYASYQQNPYLTFANIGIYHPALFEHCTGGCFRLFDLMAKAINNKQVTAEKYTGLWQNIGTPQDLMQIS